MEAKCMRYCPPLSRGVMGVFPCFIICTVLFVFFDISSAKVIRQVHPPVIQPVPQPTRQFLEKSSFYKWESNDVVKALKDTGLEVEDVNDGLTIGTAGAKESTVFLMPSYGNEIGGTVSSYDSEDKLRESVRYYSIMNKDPKSPAWWIFSKDNILLLISGKVPEEKAREYERVLNAMRK